MNIKRKLEIETHLKSNDKRYSFFTPNTVRSDVWKHFQVVKFLDTVENFARCLHCKEILSYSPRRGTGSLLRHRCVRSQFIRHPKEIPSIANCNQSKLPQKMNEEIVKRQLEFITEDLSPFHITEGNGFKKFAQALINIGAEYGKQNIEHILVSRSVLLDNAIPAEYFNIKNQLEYVLSNSHISFSTNILFDEYSQRSFLTITAHYINDDFNLNSNLLGAREFLQNKESSESIHFLVSDILSEFQIKDKLSHGVIVTQKNEDFISAFRFCKRLSCSSHIINLFMENMFEQSPTKELCDLVLASKRLINFLENPDFINGLTDSININRRKTVYSLLLYIFNMYNEIEQVLMERNEWQEISEINFNLLEQIIYFLKVFNECSENLSSHQLPTISQYCLWYEKMLRSCAIKPKDSEVITELKAQAKKALESQLKPDIIHYVALFLNPPFKSMKFLLAEEQYRTISAVKTLMKDFKIQHEKDKNFTTQPGDVNSVAPTASCHTRGGIFQEFKDTDISNVAIDKEVEEELQKYLASTVEECNILEFWKNSLELPLLRSVAKQILNIPASCKDTEQDSLTVGSILNETGSKISNESVSQVLFLNKNTRNKCKLIKNEDGSPDM